MENDTRGIGDNSLQEEGTFKSLADVVKDISDRLWKLHNTINTTINTHTASHGNEFYYADEISNQKDLDKYPATRPEYGRYRRPNPYEKKEFAGETTNKLNDTAVQLTKLAMEAEKLEKKLSKKDKVGNAE